MGLIVLLILVGVLLLLAEILLVPGVGVAGILGLTSLVGSSYYGFHYLGNDVGTVVTIINVLLVLALLVYVLRAKTWKKFELNTVIEKQESRVRDVNVGDKGKTVTRLAPMGKARFDNVSVEVTAMEGMMDAGTEVEVVLIENNKVFVKATQKSDIF